MSYWICQRFLEYVGSKISGIFQVKDVWDLLGQRFCLATVAAARPAPRPKRKKNHFVSATKNCSTKSLTWTIFREDKLERNRGVDQVSVINIFKQIAQHNSVKRPKETYKIQNRVASLVLPYFCSHPILEVRVELVEAPIHSHSDTPETEITDASIWKLGCQIRIKKKTFCRQCWLGFDSLLSSLPILCFTKIPKSSTSCSSCWADLLPQQLPALPLVSRCTRQYTWVPQNKF